MTILEEGFLKTIKSSVTDPHDYDKIFRSKTFLSRHTYTVLYDDTKEAVLNECGCLRKENKKK